MTEKGHWCGVVKWSPKKQQRPFPFCIYAVKQWNKWVIVHWTLWPWKLKKGGSWEVRVVDRALGISKRVITDASEKCWANAVRTSCPTDRNTTAVHTSVLNPVLKLLLLPSMRSYLHIFHIYQGCWHKNWKQNVADKVSTSSQAWWCGGGIYIHCWP